MIYIFRISFHHFVKTGLDNLSKKKTGWWTGFPFMGSTYGQVSLNRLFRGLNSYRKALKVQKTGNRPL
jgi:hypothetical protein